MKNTTAILIGFFLVIVPPIIFDHTNTIAVRIVAMSICTIGIALFVYGIEKELRKNDKRR
mgnify:FL=1